MHRKKITKKPVSKPVESNKPLDQPWYESTLLWGSLSLAIQFTSLAMIYDWLWLLGIAWPFYVIASWAVLRNTRTSRIWLVFFACVTGVTLYGFEFYVNSMATRAVICDQNTKSTKCPLEIVARDIKAPHPSDSEYDGITWQENFVDVRVFLTNKGDKTIQDLNIAVHPETQIFNIHQVTQISDVVLESITEILAVQILARDSKGIERSLPVPLSGAPSYRISCPRLLSGNRIQIVMACAAINAIGKEFSLFAPRRAPQWVRINGS